MPPRAAIKAMIYDFQPTYERFLDVAEPGKLVTIVRKFPNDSMTPVAAFYRLYSGREIFLFESVAGTQHESRYSLLGTDPFLHFEASAAKTPHSRMAGSAPPESDDWTPQGHYCGPGDPLDALQSLLDHYPTVPLPGLPRFCGGAVGYIGYDAVRFIENLPNAPHDDRHLPDISMDFYGTVLVFDHQESTLTVATHILVPRDDAANRDNGEILRSLYDNACEQIANVVTRLGRMRDIKMYDVSYDMKVHRGFDRSNFETPTRGARERFENAVSRCKEYIAQGDIFQVVVSQRFETTTSASPISIYRALRIVNPSPYMFYIRTGGTCLVGSSPELMLRVEDGIATVRPLAGTRRRGMTEDEDEKIAANLLQDDKERAEHVMLVDLGRNDIGRIAEYGSVRLEQVMTIEKYSHVMHISSTVCGRLQEASMPLDAMRACLPAGTVSGAPEVRAMQIIDEMEPSRRGPYAGAVGFLGFDGTLETCLALRTMVFDDRTPPDAADPEKVSGNRKVYIQAGAGIVAESIPSHEYEETLNKAKGLLKAIEVAEEWRYPITRSQKTVLSCIQPTAEMHVGNYFGAVKAWVELQETHRCFFGIVDLHAMTRLYEPDELRQHSRQMFIDLLACGIDPEKSVLFVQSMIPEHMELCWILSCYCAAGDLGRMTQFQEKSKSITERTKQAEYVSAGLLFYPVLQAADILMYQASYVPVGKDQEQHLELLCAIARRFNQRFETALFPEPQPLFTDTPKIMSLIHPDQKMSKSEVEAEKGCIGLFEDEASIRDKVRAAVTDAGPRQVGMSAGVENLFEILRACERQQDYETLQAEYKSGRLKYVDLKDAVAEALIAITGRLRARRADLLADPEFVDRQLRDMTDKARTVARETMREVRQLTGLPTSGHE